MPFDPRRPATRTRYGGYLMRSRLEAAWAEYFDAAGLAWKYEPTQFTFEDAKCQYTPDFLLLPRERFAEVKPCEPDGREYRLCRLLALWLRETVYFLIGKPWQAVVLAVRPKVFNGVPWCVVEDATLDEVTEGQR